MMSQTEKNIYICVIKTLSHDTHLTGGVGRDRDGFLTRLGSGDWDQPAAAAAVSRQPMKLRLKLLLNNTDLQAMAVQRRREGTMGWMSDGIAGKRERGRVNPAPSSRLPEEFPPAAAAEPLLRAREERVASSS